MLSEQDISNFQALYRAEFGTDISREDAHEQGLKLVTLLSHVYQPMTEEEYKEVCERRFKDLPALLEKIKSDYEQNA